MIGIRTGASGAPMDHLVHSTVAAARWTLRGTQTQAAATD
jgi:hypothetical protein